MAQTPAYSAAEVTDHGVQTVRLSDHARSIEVGVAPSIGNRTFEFLVGEKNILHFPHSDVSQLQGDRHLSGIPFLAPWANRMPEGFWANGRRYLFNSGLASIRPDENGIPIHGLLTASPFWELIRLGSDETAAWVTSRLEFSRYPDLMANWPFAHEYEMTHRLSEGALELSVTVTNRSADRMPVAIGFHPYFELPDVPITQAVAHIPVLLHVDTDNSLIPTGATTPVDFGNRVSLGDHHFDDGFTGLQSETDGRTVFYVEGARKRIEVIFGPKYRVAIVFAPPGQNFICFEPMSALTNGINLAHEGKYPDLQTIAPGKQWTESFWVKPVFSEAQR
jgi:aldose 1-epimerase